MFDSYFFIPTDRRKFIEKVDSIDSSFFVFDMEESVNNNNINVCIDNLSHLKVKSNYFLRFPFKYKKISEDKELLLKLINIGFRKFSLPKIETFEDFYNTSNFFKSHKLKDLKFGIYIETPLALINARSIVEQGKEEIDSILIGSHDYCDAVRCKHTKDNLLYLRQKLLTIGKAHDIAVIDMVSTNINNLELLKDECIESFNMGFDGKALIHPKQLEAFNNAPYYSESEIVEATLVNNELSKTGLDGFSIIKINGKVYEKPHLRRIFEIVKWNLKKNIDDIRHA
jgi:citrate lyase beta subunit